MEEFYPYSLNEFTYFEICKHFLMKGNKCSYGDECVKMHPKDRDLFVKLTKKYGFKICNLSDEHDIDTCNFIHLKKIVNPELVEGSISEDLDELRQLYDRCLILQSKKPEDEKLKKFIKAIKKDIKDINDDLKGIIESS